MLKENCFPINSQWKNNFLRWFFAVQYNAIIIYSFPPVGRSFLFAGINIIAFRNRRPYVLLLFMTPGNTMVLYWEILVFKSLGWNVYNVMLQVIFHFLLSLFLWVLYVIYAVVIKLKCRALLLLLRVIIYYDERSPWLPCYLRSSYFYTSALLVKINGR